MEISLSDLSSGPKLQSKGFEGEIAWQLVKREGTAVWIPDFIKWLMENYELSRK